MSMLLGSPSLSMRMPWMPGPDKTALMYRSKNLLWVFSSPRALRNSLIRLPSNLAFGKSTLA
ncbi:hypothetical protein DSECCO2_598660 [anaerobic digester metagenome]